MCCIIGFGTCNEMHHFTKVSTTINIMSLPPWDRGSPNIESIETLVQGWLGTNKGV